MLQMGCKNCCFSSIFHPFAAARVRFTTAQIRSTLQLTLQKGQDGGRSGLSQQGMAGEERSLYLGILDKKEHLTSAVWGGTVRVKNSFSIPKVEEIRDMKGPLHILGDDLGDRGMPVEMWQPWLHFLLIGSSDPLTGRGDRGNTQC